MAKPFRCKLGIAQISANPAYADELVSMIQEPAFPGKTDKIGLFTIAGLEEINALRQRISERYIAHLNRKLEAVIRFAASHSVEILTLPEYSVPPESLLLCKGLSDELSIPIVAGSHVVTVNPMAMRVYRELGLHVNESSKNPDRDVAVRQAVCVALVPGRKPLAFAKYVRANGEACLIPGASPLHGFEFDTRSGKLEVQVLICIEALSGISSIKEKHSHARLIAVPAFSATVEPFYEAGKLSLYQGKCSLFCNVAEFGGSKIFARADNANFWFTSQDGTGEIPQFTEALLTAHVDLEKQFEIRKLIQSHSAVLDVRAYPFLYPFASADASRYLAEVATLQQRPHSLQDWGRRLEPFTDLTPRVFPKFLQDKLLHFVNQVVSAGTVSQQEAIDWAEPLVVADTPPTDILRWELCSDSIETINQLQLSGKYLHKGKELVEVYSHLVAKRNQLTAFIQPPSKASQSPHRNQSEASTETKPAESPFIDRQHPLDRIRTFISAQESAFVISGMRGIGKSSLIREAFRQAIPPRRTFELKLTEGISYARLLSQLAYGLNLRIAADLDIATTEKQEELLQRILSHIGQGPAYVIVIDEFQYLLNSVGDVEDPFTEALVLQLLEASLKTRTKLFFLSDLAPNFSPEIRSYCAHYSLQGLATEDTKRLLIYWFQYGREDLRGQPPAPSERFVSLLGGHPLATKVAAQLWADHPSSDISRDLAIFEKLRNTIVPFILERITLTDAETRLLLFASIFRLPVSREVFLRWGGDEANYVLNSLASQYLIESDEKGYELHPLVRDFFYHKLAVVEAMQFHKVAGKHYMELFEKAKNATRQLVPEYLGEAVHHYLAAGERKKVQSLAFYKQELKPVALSHYRKKEYGLALNDYLVLLELDERDPDVHFHLALIYARKESWGDAEFHFGRALELRPRAVWIIQGYANAKLRAGREGEAELLLSEAEEINPNHPGTLLDFGRIRERQGRLGEAEDYYRRAIAASADNSFAYYQLAHLLYRQGEINESFEMAQLALATDPVDARNKALVEKLKKQIQDLNAGLSEQESVRGSSTRAEKPPSS